MATTRPALSIDGLLAELKTLATISEAEPPVVTRVVFSEADLRARSYVKELCAHAGLSISVDAIGNTLRDGRAANRSSRRLALVHTLMRFQTRVFMTAAWGYLAGLKQFAFFSSSGSSRAAPSNSLSSPQRNRRDSASDAWAAG